MRQAVAALALVDLVRPADELDVRIREDAGEDDGVREDVEHPRREPGRLDTSVGDEQRPADAELIGELCEPADRPEPVHDPRRDFDAPHGIRLNAHASERNSNARRDGQPATR